MEIETRLDNIDKKIEGYNEKIDNISSLITTLIHTFQQNQLPNVKTEIINSIEEKFKDSANFPDVEEMKQLFNQIQEDFSEKQSGLKIKFAELENVIAKINTTIENFSGGTTASIDESFKEQLETIEKNLKTLSTKVSSIKNLPSQVAAAIPETGIYSEKIEGLEALANTQYKAQKNIEKQLKSLDENIKTIINLPVNSADKSNDNIDMEQIQERFNDLNLAITSVLSAIKIIDKKYTELKSFQEVIDNLTTNVVSPILLASGDIKSFVENTSNNFAEINNFVKEYDKGAFNELQNKVEKIADTVNIDVNRLFNLVDEFKTTTDLSNHTISDNMEKIENMLTEYNENLEELTKSATADVIKDGVKSLNDEFYLELLDLFNSLSFEEETEDLKDFIEGVLESITVKTDENSEKLNSIMLQFKSLLNKIDGIEKAQNSISDYLKPEDTADLVYSFDDIQSDLAKMRLVLNDISKSVASSDIVEEISDKIRKTGEQIENVSRLLGTSSDTDENVTDIRQKIEELNSQVYDISVRTNKLILSNEDSTLELKNNLEIFKEVFDKANPEKLYDLFYELTHYFNDVTEKINEVLLTTKASHTEAVTIKNALVYVGEWLDNATNVLEELRTNSAELLKQKNETDTLYQEIKTLRQSIDSDITNIMARIKLHEEDTQKRFDKLEAKIDELLANKTSSKETTSRPINTKLDNINKKFGEMEEVLSKLSEKLMKE